MQNGPKALRLARAITARPTRGLRRDTAARDLPPSPRCRVPMTAAEHIFSAAKGDHSCANAPTAADYTSRLSSPRLLLVTRIPDVPLMQCSSGRSSRRLLHRAHRFARLPALPMSCPGRSYRWRHDLRSAAAGFAEVVVAPGPEQRMAVASPAEIELGRDIRVRVAATAPKDLVSAIIKALAAR